MIVADASARLHDQSWRKNVGLIDGSALLVLDTGALKRTVCRATCQPENRLLKNILYSTAEAEGNTVVDSPIVIEFDIERIWRFSELCVLGVVIGEPGQVSVR